MIRIDNTKTNATISTFTVIDEASKSATRGYYASCCDNFHDAIGITSHATMREQNDTAHRLGILGYRFYDAGKMSDVEGFRRRVEAAR